MLTVPVWILNHEEGFRSNRKVVRIPTLGVKATPYSPIVTGAQNSQFAGETDGFSSLVMYIAAFSTIVANQ